MSPQRKNPHDHTPAAEKERRQGEQVVQDQKVNKTQNEDAERRNWAESTKRIGGETGKHTKGGH